MRAKRLGPPAPRLASIRSRWLSSVTASLRDDQLVFGAGFVGSLGDGRADDWSDVDLLVIVDDACLDDYTAPGSLPLGPGRLAVAFDARQNGPRGTRAVSGQYIVDGLPLWVDWHLRPVSKALWPVDSTVIFDRQGFERSSVTFSEHLEAGDHEQSIPKDANEHRALRMALVPVAGKLIARRSPDTGSLIEFLGGPNTPAADGEAHVHILRELLDGFDDIGLPDSVTAGRAYLDLVEEALG